MIIKTINESPTGFENSDFSYKLFLMKDYPLISLEREKGHHPKISNSDKSILEYLKFKKKIVSLTSGKNMRQLKADLKKRKFGEK